MCSGCSSDILAAASGYHLIMALPVKWQKTSTVAGNNPKKRDSHSQNMADYKSKSVVQMTLDFLSHSDTLF